MIIPLYGGLLYKKATPASGQYSLLFDIISVLVWEISGLPFGINSMYIALVAGTLGFLLGLTSKTKSAPKQIAMVDLFKEPE